MPRTFADFLGIITFSQGYSTRTDSEYVYKTFRQSEVLISGLKKQKPVILKGWWLI